MSILRLPHLSRTKTGIYGYRRRVPGSIRAKVGKTEILKSFDTADPKAVKPRHAAFHAIVERTFADAKINVGNNVNWVAEDATRSFKSGLPVDEAQGEWTTDDRTSAVGILLANGGMQGLARDLVKLREVSTKVAIGQGTMSRSQPKISHALQLKLEDYARGRDKQREDFIRYVRERRRMVADLIGKIGDKDITKVSRADARSFLTHLESNGYSAGSIKKQIAFLKAMFGIAFHEIEYNGINPWGNLKIVVPEDDDGNGVSLEYAEVRTMLAKVETINNDLQHIIRLLACTGARLGEIAGLELGDVDLERGAISLRFNTIRRLKNRKSIRIVPIVDARSLEALRKRLSRYKARGREAPVFPRYGRPNGSSSASAALGKWLTKIKLRDPEAAKPKTTHSLRHTFKDAMRELGVSRDIANKIQGHTAGDAADDYGSSDLLAAKREVALRAWALIMDG